jgi:hemerythrin-like metal-binding protein
MEFTIKQQFRVIPTHLPDWLYNGLPYLYFSVGLATALSVPTAMALISGVMLMFAGVTVGMMRYRFRRAFKNNYWLRDILEEGNEKGTYDAGFVYIAWRSAYELGHPVIDEQHRQLFVLGNELVNAVLCRKPKTEIEPMLNRVVKDVTEHFCAEEATLARTAHALSKKHQEIHRSLLVQAKDLRDKFHNDQVNVRELIDFVVYDLVTEHIVREDTKLGYRP